MVTEGSRFPSKKAAQPRASCNAEELPVLAARLFVVPLVVAPLACNPSAASDRRDEDPLESATATLATSSAMPPSPASVAPPGPAPSRGEPGGSCPADMRLVSGNHCPAAEQRCLAWNEINVTGVVERNQCKTYAAPAHCLSKTRTPMRFCMDTYEWPNQKGATPRNLTSWQEAKDTCEGIGKRLCTDVEFTFACEGEAIKPHVTGFARDPAKCSYDRPYRPRTFNFLKHDACLADPACKAALEAIDQRLPAGSMPECVSDDGVYDLNGNVNEWIALPNRGFSKRAGLKGGWWGPVRDRCRPITTFHGESDYGYEVGFRCCKDAL
ncbi:MAG: SUMF1/EgtB/PvdO family nonheme iron enzyme [Myxococcales bacterium]|nr:SUMF1/EgtB/PvdO family nonheme iron enzyme [Myxococcales bacterium]